ncbi:uncharacterized protein LOC105423536 [Pogonomyrmex barbatus]|uniref:Uncharacterized protein LOC105423536 n=1 Tax=Pogonomyrmex barbatus TaxID=144034 RepID=A0A6I9WIR9_9HYME|nr:uncharacterized protein LOC105423536 [Pogonomyrmex barbatus]
MRNVFRVKPRLSDQIMGPLPPDRITACQRVFSIVGIDYAGPIVTVASKGRGQRSRKSYIALFICFSTKAVHLEAVSELTSSAFLAALRCFVSRRGYPQKIYSDNATNFVGAKRELEELYRTIRTFSKSIEEYCTSQSIEWKFIPPTLRLTWVVFGKQVSDSCKYHLKRVVGETRLVFEELMTVLAQIEACLNSRPLCQLSSDPNDLQALTPAHFLIGGPLISLPDINVLDVPINRLDRWQLTQRITQHFLEAMECRIFNVIAGQMQMDDRKRKSSC